MKLKVDLNKEYAVALGGGGAKGAYEVGLWDAFNEAGMKITAVSGTSVGAINGAFMAMNELELAKKLWCELTYSKVMDVDDSIMRNLLKVKLGEMNFGDTVKTIKDTLKNKGFDVTPLLDLFDEYVDEAKVRNSDMDYYIVTVSLTDKKEMELRAKDLGEGEIHEMMLASAYLPVFKNVKLGGKRYVDGGFADSVPVHVLVENGYRDIIAIDLNGIGADRKVKLPKDAEVLTISPTCSIGSTLDFDVNQSEANLKIGYYDGLRFLYGLEGTKYYIDRTMTEQEAYDVIADIAYRYVKVTQNKDITLREMNEKIIPKLEKRLFSKGEDYYSLFVDALEVCCRNANVERFAVYTDKDLLRMVNNLFDPESGRIPKEFTSIVSSVVAEMK